MAELKDYLMFALISVTLSTVIIANIVSGEGGGQGPKIQASVTFLQCHLTEWQKQLIWEGRMATGRGRGEISCLVTQIASHIFIFHLWFGGLA